MVIKSERISENMCTKNAIDNGGSSNQFAMPTGGKYILCHFLFFLLGICHYMPAKYFTAANNFWFYKFGDTTKDTDAIDRTYLQKSYASIFMLTNCLMSFVSGVFNVVYGYRLKIMPRVIVTLSIYLVIFFLLNISVVVDTDSWQILFYTLVVTGYGVLSGASTVNAVAGMNLYPRFPKEFMKTCLTGEGASGSIADVLNIVSISIFNGDMVKSTLLYFCFGTFIATLTLVLSVVLSRMEFFKNNINSIPSKDKSILPTKPELFVIIKKIKTALFISSMTILCLAAAHPTITSLVVSEQNTGLWAKSYFSPVMTFALSNLCGLLGRIISSYFPYKMSDNTLCLFAFIKTVVLIPMIWLCNAQPRSHLPVVFEHDWQYGIIIGLFMMAIMYCHNETIVRIPRLVDPSEVDLAYTVLTLGLNTFQAVFSPVGLFIVAIL